MLEALLDANERRVTAEPVAGALAFGATMAAAPLLKRLTLSNIPDGGRLRHFQNSSDVRAKAKLERNTRWRRQTGGLARPKYFPKVTAVEPGSEAAKVMEAKGLSYVTRDVPAVEVAKQSKLQLKTSMGLMDHDPSGGIRRLRPDLRFNGFLTALTKEPTLLIDYEDKTKSFKGIRNVVRNTLEDSLERGPWMPILRRLGFADPETRLLRKIKTEFPGLTPLQYRDKLTNMSDGRFGTFTYTTKPGQGGDIIRGNTDKFLTSDARRGKGDLNRVKGTDLDIDFEKGKIKDVPVNSGVTGLSENKKLGKFLGLTGKTLPVVAGVHDAFIVADDIKQGDWLGALMHGGDFAIDTITGPLSLLATIPVAAMTGEEPQGFVSALGALVGITESDDSSEAGVSGLVDTVEAIGDIITGPEGAEPPTEEERMRYEADADFGVTLGRF